MVQIAHEVWRTPDRNGFEFGIPHPRSDAFRQQHEPNARLLHVIYAASSNAAMSAYYAWQGWGAYRAVAEYDTIYTDEHLEAQKRLRPEHYR